MALLASHRILTVELAANGLVKGIKATEAALADAKEKGLVRSQPLVGNKRCYSLTEAGAAMVGLGGPGFRRPQGAQAIFQNLLIATFFLAGHTRWKLMTTHAFRKTFPELAALPGAKNRYFLDCGPDVPLLTLIVPDLNASFSTVATKARRAVAERRKHEPFRDMMYAKPTQFSVVILTPFERKAERIREALSAEKFHHSVVFVPGLEQLFLFGRDQ